MQRLLFLPLFLLTTACASVYLGNGTSMPATSPSATTADSACSQRLWQAIGSPPAIQVECRDGTVILRGLVATAAGRDALVDYVRRQPGVERVIDRLVVR